MIGCAYLRVFQPFEALPDEERSRLESVPSEAPAPAGRPTYRHLGPAASPLGLLEASSDHAAVRSEEGRRFGCPSRTRIRVLTAMLSLRESIAPEVAEALVPDETARMAARELERVRRGDPRAVPTVLQSPWHVPVRWFVLFEDGERRMAERAEGGFRVTYWTTLGLARRRAQRASRVLRHGGLEPVADMVGDLEEWLSCFDPASRVELDYGEAASWAGWNELDDDHSAAEVQEALQALGRGDPDRAGELYRSVAGRWAEARIRESLN